ncbi:MAG: hypothetical protein IJL32_00155 [Oscillospiraceae bacterium]|nr:hypothetical protein [Oscillospiraceae bacterium]
MKMEQANTITLNTLQELLNPALKKAEYLPTLFPPALRETDSTHLLDFIYEQDTALRNARTSFLNGNVVRYPAKQTCSRAHQNELNLIGSYLRSPETAGDWTQFLQTQFPFFHAEALEALIPEDASRYPKQFAAELQQTSDPYRKLLLMILWAVFGERITTVAGIYTQAEAKSGKPDEFLFRGSVMMEGWTEIDYFRSMTAHPEQIQQLDMAFHMGTSWLSDGERMNMMINMLESGTVMRILIDDEDMAWTLSTHINNKNRFSLPFSLNLQYWQEFERRHGGAVEVRLSPVPILRNYTRFTGRTPDASGMRVVFYTYGNFYFGQYYSIFPETDSPEYELFRIEFEYLWEKSKPINENKEPHTH